MDDPNPLESRASRWFIPVILFLGTLLLIGFSANIVTGELRNSLDDQTIRAAWHWNPYNVPHPPFSRIVSGFAKEISSPFLDKFSAYRMGPALFFAVLVTVIYLWMKELFGG